MNKVLEMIINTIRMIHNDQAAEHAFGDNKSLKENVAVGFINPKIMQKLNLRDKTNIKISTEFGSVILRPVEDETIPESVINIPISIWANQITGIKEEELVYKNINAKVESTIDPVLNFEDLMEKIKL